MITPAGLSLTTGKPEDFFLMYFSRDEQERTRFRLQLAEPVANVNHDLAFIHHLERQGVDCAVFDFPLTQPLCFGCPLVCPGSEKCPQNPVQVVRQKIATLLEDDAKIYQKNPKKYEVERRAEELTDFSADLLEKRTDEHLLSKAFKRRLRKGISPYHNRPLDFWVWQHYYDAYLAAFQSSFDSFGDISFGQLAYYEYWKRHLPKDFKSYETSPQLVLLELYRAEFIDKKQVLTLGDIHQAPLARLEIVRALTHKLQLIITERQYDQLVRAPRAFTAFLLAVAGLKLTEHCTYDLPSYTDAPNTHFFVPRFSNLS